MERKKKTTTTMLMLMRVWGNLFFCVSFDYLRYFESSRFLSKKINRALTKRPTPPPQGPHNQEKGFEKKLCKICIFFIF